MKNIDNKYVFSNKWTPEIEQYGFTQIPNLLFSCQGHLHLKDGELTTLFQLLTFWFDRDGRVYPSITTLTRFSSKGYSTVQRRLRTLEEKGFVKRHQRLGTSNTYDLSPCIRRLYEHQKTCQHLPHRRGVSRVKVKQQPTSFSINKEYERKRRNSKETKESVGDILSQRYEGRVWR